MQGHDRVIELLNELLTAELTAINQYFLNSRMCEGWGFERLAKKHYEASIDEMNDADRIIKRILFLEGLPNLQRLGSIRIGETPIEQLELATETERDRIGEINQMVGEIQQLGDHATAEFLADLLGEEEEDLDWLEAQLEAVERLGETAYLAEQLHE